MNINSKEILARLLENDPEARAEWEKDFKLKNDPGLHLLATLFVKPASMNYLNCSMCSKGK
jgi:undecaprenyl-phosphate galactose phosphotransferase